MPSAQKQQTTVSQNGAVTTTTTITTAAPTTTAFTQQELGTRSMARQVERQIDRMNQEKAQAPREFRGSIIDHDVSQNAEDFSFGSTNDIEKVPERVRIILEKHDIDTDKITRIIHIPGARYFSVAQTTDTGKKYDTFMLDEYIPPPPEDPYAIEEVEVEDPDDNPENWNEQTFDIPVEAIEKEFDVRAKNMNTLGTINPTVVNDIKNLNQEVTVPPSVLSETVAQPQTETVRIEVKEEVPVVQTSLELSQKKLKEARMSSARENDAYYANKYGSSTLGTLHDLFGNNEKIHSELFKTVKEYENLKQSFLKEISSEKWNIAKVIEWLKNEQIEKARLFSHDKYGLFVKVASKFNLTVPSVVETRTGSFAMKPVSKEVSITERLGIKQATNSQHKFLWQCLFTKAPEQTTVVENESHATDAIVDSDKEIKSSISVEQKPAPEKTVERSLVFHKLYPIIKDVLLVGSKKDDSLGDSLSETQTDQLSLENNLPDANTSNPIVINPEPVSVSPALQNSSTKQHPENLFA